MADYSELVEQHSVIEVEAVEISGNGLAQETETIADAEWSGSLFSNEVDPQPTSSRPQRSSLSKGELILRLGTLPTGEALLVAGSSLTTFGLVNAFRVMEVVVILALLATLTSILCIYSNRHLLINWTWVERMTWARVLAVIMVAALLPLNVVKESIWSGDVLAVLLPKLVLLMLAILIAVGSGFAAIATMRMTFTLGNHGAGANEAETDELAGSDHD